MGEIQQDVASHDDQIVVLFEHLKRLLEANESKNDPPPRKKIGFKNE